MSITGSIALYFIIWWTVLFVVLPFGVKSQAETGDVIAGTEPGAPALPAMKTKFLWTTAIATMVFAGVYAALQFIEL